MGTSSLSCGSKQGFSVHLRFRDSLLICCMRECLAFLHDAEFENRLFYVNSVFLCPSCKLRNSAFAKIWKNKSFFSKLFAGRSKATEGGFPAAVCPPPELAMLICMLPPHHSTASPPWGVGGDVQGQILPLPLGRQEQWSEPLLCSPSKCCSLSQVWGKTWAVTGTIVFFICSESRMNEGHTWNSCPSRHHNCLVTQHRYQVLVLGRQLILPEGLCLPLGYFLHGKSSRIEQLKLSKICIHLLFLSRGSLLASPPLTPGRSINQLHSDSAALLMLIMHLAAGGKHHLWCQVH